MYKICLSSEGFQTAQRDFNSLAISYTVGQSNISIQMDCTYCRSSVNLIRKLARDNQQLALDCLVHFLCATFLRTQWTPKVCFQTYRTYKKDVLEILLDSKLSARQICGNMIGLCSIVPTLEWNISVPDMASFMTIENLTSFEEPVVANVENNRNVLKILQLSDAHLQFDYQPGSNLHCNEPICCSSGNTTESGRSAGYFGSFGLCDLPIWTADAILQHISDTEKNIDAIYYTGDSVSHRVWSQNLYANINASLMFYSLLQKHFESKRCPMYFSIGNHDIFPCNLFPIEDSSQNSSQVMYDSMIEIWTSLGKLEDSQSIRKGGFYSTMLLPHSNIRLITLNTNYGSGENFWLAVNQTDPMGQLQWLVDELVLAEQKNQKVHIIGHHCPSVCLLSWNVNFAKIIERFNRTITAMFFGHAHDDRFVVFHGTRGPTALGILAPSLTTYIAHRPAYRIYTVDSQNGNILDYVTFTIDIESSNRLERLIVEQEYSMKDLFQMPNLTPSSYEQLLSMLKKDINGPLMDLFLRIVYKYPTQPVCNEDCRLKILSSFEYKSPFLN